MARKSFLKGALCGALAMLLVGGALTFTGVIGISGVSPVSRTTQKKLNTIEKLIDAVYLHDYKDQDLQDGILAGYVNGLDDPYSVYYNKEETEALNESTSGQYCGIGAVLTEDASTGVISIVSVYEDSPADKAGIKADDILYKVEGEEVTGIDLSSVVAKVKGEEGTDVHMTMLRGDDNEEVEVTATRSVIDVQTVESKMMDNKIGYIQIAQFDSVTYDQYMDALNKLEDEGMKGLVVDLRSNPGGLLTSVCDILDQMLPKGLIVYTEDKNGERKEFTSDDEHQFKLPMVVLVNGNSASASEIYTGAIQDYGLGKIVGTQTYGKGVVQQLYDLKDGTSVKLTVSQYFTPKGRCIDGEGITPDVKVEYKANEKDEDADNQLDKAVEVLKEEMK